MAVPKPKQLPSGNWRVQVVLDGKRRSFTDSNKARLMAKVTALKARDQNPDSTELLTLEMCADEYINDRRNTLSPTTIQGYEKIRNNNLDGLLHLRLPQITQQKIQAHINKLAADYSPKTIGNIHGFIVSVLHVYKPDLVLRTKLPQADRNRVSIPTEEEISKISEIIRGTEIELPVLLAMWRGMTISEIRGIDVDRDHTPGHLHIQQSIVDVHGKAVTKKPKETCRDRIVAINDEMEALLPPSGPLTTLTAQAITKRFYRLLAKNSIPHYNFHALRHVCASIMLRNGVPNKYAREIMGHSTDAMLNKTYQHILQSKLDDTYAGLDDYFQRTGVDK